MVKLSFFIGALLVSSANAFAPRVAPKASIVTVQSAKVLPGAEVDSVGNNIAVRDLLVDIEETGLLTKVAQSGLLSKAQEAGISLSKLEPLLALAAENPDVLILVEASGPELLPLLPTIVDVAPAALPLLAAAVSIPPAVLTLGAVASLATAGAAITFIPDDTVTQVALQTLAAGIFGVAVPVASLAGAAVLGQLTK